MSKRFVIFSLLFSFFMASAFAIPAKPGQWRVITLADGTKVKVMLRGDERLHYLEDSLGNAYQRVPETTFYQQIDKEQLTARTKKLNTANRLRRNARQAKRAKSTGGLIGEKKGLIILVEFSDQSFDAKHDKSYFERVANEKNFRHEDGFEGSVYDYFYAQSEGLFQLTFDLVGPVKLDTTYVYYGKNVLIDGEWNDIRDGEFAYDAIMAVKDSVDFSKYDWDGDGEVDQVYLLYAGPGEANYGDDDTIWPHEWDLSSAYQTITLNDVLINTYACGCELQPDELDWQGNVKSWMIDGIGTICHEFSHCLGYPDFYDTNYKAQGMGYWDLMDSGAYNDDGFLPAGYTSYERWVAGWKEPIVLSEPTAVTDMKALSEGGDSYILYNDRNENEYFLLENRQQTNWDEALPGKGLLILHVDYSATAWEENTVNDVANHQRMTWIAADNIYRYSTIENNRYYDFSDMATDTYPYGSNNSFGNTTSPAAKLFNRNTDGTKNLNKKVYDITQNDDGSISFSFDYDDSHSGDVEKGDTIFYESFDDCKGSGGNDGVWGNINVSNWTDYYPDHNDWVTSFARGGDQCAFYGSGKVQGLTSTPVIMVEDGDSLSFKAAPWGDNDDEIDIIIKNEQIRCTPSTFQLSANKWTDCKTQFIGTGDAEITFLTGGKRFFLDEVLVFCNVSTGIYEVNAVQPFIDNRIYTLDGRYVGTDIRRLVPGLYLVGGKKMVISRK